MFKPASLLVVALLLFSGCVTDENGPEVTPRRPMTSPTGEDTRVIGLVGTMSGEDMWRGEDAFEGADLAVHILNRSVTEGRPPFELVTLDDKGDPERATDLVEELAGNANTVGIVYAGPPEGLPPAERALTLAKIPAVLCYGDLYAARLLRPHIFQASPSYLWEARVIGRYIVKDRRYRRVGVIAERSLDGDVAVASIRSALRPANKLRVIISRYAEGASLEWKSVSPQAKVFRRARVQSLVVQGDPGFVADVRMALRQSTTRSWDPQLIGFDLSIYPTVPQPQPGTVATDSYARGAHFLPVPSFERFRDAFKDWWDGAEPLGWEQRAYDAASMIGWAAQKAPAGEDIAATLETLQGARFGGLDVTFGPSDHTAIDEKTVGLWVRPRSAFDSLIPSDDLPWLPLARGFSFDGDRTVILDRDWRYLFRDPPPPGRSAPKVDRMRYAVTSPRSDPVH